jgi:hypothetical protein
MERAPRGRQVVSCRAVRRILPSAGCLAFRRARNRRGDHAGLGAGHVRCRLRRLRPARDPERSFRRSRRRGRGWVLPDDRVAAGSGSHCDSRRAPRGIMKLGAESPGGPYIPNRARHRLMPSSSRSTAIAAPSLSGNAGIIPGEPRRLMPLSGGTRSSPGRPRRESCSIRGAPSTTLSRRHEQRPALDERHLGVRGDPKPTCVRSPVKSSCA